MFIRLNDGSYIPMIESGDNNVWDCDNRRRAREWSACRWLHETEQQRKLFSLTEKDIMNLARQEVLKTIERNIGESHIDDKTIYTEENVRNNLSYFNCIQIYGHPTTTANQFLNFFKSGFRNAIGFDELRNGLRLSWYELPEGKTSTDYQIDFAFDEKELKEKWDALRARGITPWIGISSADGEYNWNMISMRKKKNRPKKKNPSEQYIISFNYASVKRYLVKLTSRNLKFNPFPEDAYRYSSEKLAQNARGRIIKRFTQLSDVSVEKIPATQS